MDGIHLVKYTLYCNLKYPFFKIYIVINPKNCRSLRCHFEELSQLNFKKGLFNICVNYIKYLKPARTRNINPLLGLTCLSDLAKIKKN